MESVSEIRVRGYQVDHFGHVNHARYVEFLEEARWALLDEHRPIVERLHKKGIFHAVVRLEINYRCPAKLGDRLLVKTAIKQVGRTSLVVSQDIIRLGDDRLIADAQVTNVFIDGTTGHPISIREDMLGVTEQINGRQGRRQKGDVQ